MPAMATDGHSYKYQHHQIPIDDDCVRLSGNTSENSCRLFGEGKKEGWLGKNGGGLCVDHLITHTHTHKVGCAGTCY